MKKLCLFLLLIVCPLSAKCQKKFFDMKMRRVLAEAFEFALLEGTIERGRYLFIPDTTVHKAMGSFPIHDGDNYKFVYWKNIAAPVACGTVIFDRDVNVKTAVVDTSVRLLKPEELRIIKLIRLVADDIIKDGKAKVYENSYGRCIPLNTVWGHKVYAVWRSKNWREHLFAEDYEYAFDSKDQIVSKVKAHERIESIRMDGLDSLGIGTKPLKGTAFHSHKEHNNQGALISDLGGVIASNVTFGWKSFVLSDKDHVYIINLDTIQINQLTHRQYKEYKKSHPDG